MDASLEQMIIDAVDAPGIAHQISAALIAGDALEVGLIVRRAVEAVRKDYAELAELQRQADEDEREFRAEIEARRREDAMDTLTGLSLGVKP